MKFHSRFRSIVSATAVLAFVTCAPAQAQERLVRFADLPGTGNLLVKTAIEKGYCAQQGIKCELKVIPGLPLAMQAMLAGTIEAALAPADVLVSAIKNGSNIKMVTGALLTSQTLLVASSSMPVPPQPAWPSYFHNFKGKRVGVTARGASTEISMRHLLKKAGVNPEDVTFVAVGGAMTAYNALSTKQVDAVVAGEPLSGICQQTGACRVVWRGSTDKEPSELFAFNGSALTNVFTQSYLDANPRVAEGVIAAMKAAEAFVNNPANFEDVYQISQKYFKLEFANGDQIMRDLLRSAISSGTYRASIDRDSLRRTLQYLVDDKIIESQPPLTQLVYEKAP